MVDARLPDGSRLHAVIPPLAVDGPCVTIRRFGARAVTLDAFGVDGAAAAFLRLGGRARVEPPRRRRHQRGQDHAAQRAVAGDPDTRAHRHHRGDGRAPARAAARRAARGPARRTPRARAGSRCGRSCGPRCACVPIGSSSARCAAARRSTCSRRSTPVTTARCRTIHANGRRRRARPARDPRAARRFGAAARRRARPGGVEHRRGGVRRPRSHGDARGSRRSPRSTVADRDGARPLFARRDDRARARSPVAAPRRRAAPTPHADSTRRSRASTGATCRADARARGRRGHSRARGWSPRLAAPRSRTGLASLGPRSRWRLPERAAHPAGRSRCSTPTWRGRPRRPSSSGHRREPRSRSSPARVSRRACAVVAVLAVLVGGPGRARLARSRRERALRARRCPGALEQVAAELRGGGTVAAARRHARRRRRSVAPDLRRVRTRTQLGLPLERRTGRGGRPSTTRPACGPRPARSRWPHRWAGAPPTPSTGSPTSLRHRLDAVAEARALSAQARLSAVVVGAAPLGYLAFSALVDPRAVDALVGTGVGRVCLVRRPRPGGARRAVDPPHRAVGGMTRPWLPWVARRRVGRAAARCRSRVARARVGVDARASRRSSVHGCAPSRGAGARAPRIAAWLRAARGPTRRRSSECVRSLRARRGVDARGRRARARAAGRRRPARRRGRGRMHAVPRGRGRRRAGRPHRSRPRSPQVLRSCALGLGFAAALDDAARGHAAAAAAGRRAARLRSSRCARRPGARPPRRRGAHRRCAGPRGARPAHPGAAPVPARVPRAARVRAAHGGARARGRAAVGSDVASRLPLAASPSFSPIGSTRR